MVSADADVRRCPPLPKCGQERTSGREPRDKHPDSYACSIMRNIEVKVRVDDLEPVRVAALALGAEDHGTLVQVDQFFTPTQGRLKLRTEGTRSTLIAYDRPDASEARGSEYVLAEVSDPDGLSEALVAAVGRGVEVRKARHFLVHGHTRIHLDTVERLGTFVELETVVGDGLSDEAGTLELGTLRSRLGLDAAQVVPVAYADLIDPPS